MVDKAKLDQMISNLRRYVIALRRLGDSARQEFLGDADKIGSTKYHFVIAIECCIDIANHIIASENLRFPKDNADSFIVLVEEGIVPEERRDALRAMARFRNRLVHLYWDVSDELVYEYLQESLSDLDNYSRIITQHEW